MQGSMGKGNECMNDLILYTTDDGRSQIQLRAGLGRVWLSLLEIAELFDATKQNISLHLKNLFEDGELDTATTVKESLTVQIEGTRKVQRPVKLYILAVGYRVGKMGEARAADAQDKADLRALESTIKNRPKT
jgi:hypothetical protein